MHREKMSVAATTYGRMGGFGRRDIDGLVAEPYALEFAFLPHQRTVLEHPGGRIEDMPILPHSGGAVGCDPVRFMETDGPSEFVEIRPASWLRQEVVADMRAEATKDHERLWNRKDPALCALAMRIRAHAFGGTPLSCEELEDRLRNALARSLEAVGAPLRPKTERGLDMRRVERVVAYIHAHLADDLRLGTLADVAATSRYHFARMFERTAGMPPHAFITALRMDRAAAILQSGGSVAHAARQSGYAPGHSFRSAFNAQFGRSPARYAQ
ncbi:AraC family transcriptional regulator [Tateyamaria omphalii]|uniref:helix-turn-helix domain-containing protein n=1 Tax=Tateyamaria omphalii TaxID=299262 RepID=UPI001C99DB02|nr:AraC family transcriptional regulator [Tateyamaria omphalii]MBY5935010.1 AraC family transcriptional regulator [Tateyamaria omphalii]